MHFHRALPWLKREECHSHPGCLLLLWWVDCDVNVRACLHADPFIFNPTLTLLVGWLLGGGLPELPVHVVMWTSVQWIRRVWPSPGRPFGLRTEGRVTPSTHEEPPPPDGK